MRHLAVVLALVVGVADAAADAPRGVVDARQHFADLDFELVLTDAAAVIADGSATVPAKVEVLFLRASALVVLDRDPEATSSFDALLALEPEYRVPADTAPRIRAAFEAARAARKVHLEEQLAQEHGDQLRAVTLAIDPPVAARGGRPLPWRVRLTDPHKLVSRVVLGYRRETDRDYALITSTPELATALTIPGEVVASNRDYRLAWYVQAVHANGARVRQSGDDAQPNWLSVAAGQPPRPPGITSRWWFWAGLVTIAASAITVPILIDRARDVGPQQIVIGG